MARTSTHAAAKAFCIILILALLFGWFRSPGLALMATHYVAPGGNCGGAAPCYAAIQAAVDAAAAGDEVKIATGVYSGVNSLGGLSQVVYINKSITLRGGYTIADWNTADPVASPTTLNAQGSGRVIAILGPAEVHIVGLRLTGGSASGLRGLPGSTSVNAGGGIYALNAALTIENGVISGNTASSEASKSGYGGGVFAYGGSLTISNSTLETNLGSPVYYGVGGGVYASACSSIDLTNNLIQKNTGSTNQLNAGGGNGGGVHIDDSAVVLTGNTITGNTGSTGPGGLASASGGGVYVSGGSLSMSGNTLSENIAAKNKNGWGGGLWLSDTSADLVENTFLSNTASTSLSSYGLGGGIYAYFGSVITMTRNTFQENLAASGGTGWGGGIYIEDSNATLLENNVRGNTGSAASTGYGGGIFLAGSTTDPGIFVLRDNTITGNRASRAAAGYGGGIDAGYAGYITELTMSGNLLENNTAGAATEGIGGGLRLKDSQANLSANLIRYNQALSSETGTSAGGGMYVDRTAVTLVNNIVAGNHAGTHGAGLYFLSPDQYTIKPGNLLHNTIADNAGCGEGIYAYTWTDLTMKNNIFSGHTAYGVFAATAYSTIDLDSTLWHQNNVDSAGSGTITRLNDYNGDAGYTAPLTGDYHLGSASAAIDKGVDAQITADLDGQMRPYGFAADLGADEYYQSGGPATAEMQAFAPQWFMLKDPLTGDVQTTLQQRYLLQILHHDLPGYTASFTDTLPSGFSFRSELHTPPMAFEQQAGSLSWRTENMLPPDQAAQVLLTMASDGIAPLSTIANLAEASAGTWKFDLQAASQAPLYPPLISTPGNGEICQGNLQVSGAAFPNTTVKVYENNVEKATTTADASGVFTATYLTSAGGIANVYLTAVSCLLSAPGQCSAPSKPITLTRPLSFICPQPSTMENTPASGPFSGQTLVYRFVNDDGWFVGDGAVFHLKPPHVNSTVHLYRRSCAEMGAPANSVERVWLEILRNDVTVATYNPSSVNLPWYNFLIDMDLADEPGEMEFLLSCEWEGQTNSAEVNTMVFSSRATAEPSLSGIVYDVTKGLDPQNPGANGVQGVPVTAMMYSADWGGWVPWPAHLYSQQANPQLTGEEGQFIFLPPAGSYYLEVDGGASYQSWRSPVIQVGSQPLQITIPLTPRYQGADSAVRMGGYGPFPATLQVGVGDVVQWRLEANPALTLEEQKEVVDNPQIRLISAGAYDPLTSVMGFDSGMLATGNIYQRQFTQPGNYAYVDGAGHSGVVKVSQKLYLPLLQR